MAENNARLAEKLVRRTKMKKLMRGGLSVLCVLVTLMTYHVLRFRADTLERVASCGYPDHVHDESCYNGDGNLICEEHVHTDACYQMRPTVEDLAAVPEPEPEPASEPTEVSEPEALPETATEPASEPVPEAVAGSDTEITPAITDETMPESGSENNQTDTQNDNQSDNQGENPEQQEEELIPEQINPIEQTGNEVTQEAIDKPTVETIPELPALNAWVSANQRSVFASDEASFTLRYEGAELAAVHVVVKQGDDVIYESDAFTEKVTVTTVSARHAGEIALTVTLTDIHGQTVEASASIPYAVHDSETAEQWESSIWSDYRETGVWADDLLAIANTQVGYRESEKDFVIQPDGTRQGWTRYGAWSKAPYSEWCAEFVQFCLNYAKIPRDYFPVSSSPAYWVDALKEKGLYFSRAKVEPLPGDLIFFDMDEDGIADHVGIFEEYSWRDGEPVMCAIEGNVNGGEVASMIYSKDESSIMGYGLLSTAYDRWLASEAAAEEEQKTEEQTEKSTVEETDGPTVETIEEKTNEKKRGDCCRTG